MSPVAPAQAGRGWLVRLPNYVGDTVCALPALHGLAAHGPLIAFGRPWAVPLLAAAGIEALAYPRELRARVDVLRTAARRCGLRRLLLLTHSFSSALDARLAGLRPTGYAKDARRWLLAGNAGPLPDAHLVEVYERLAACALAEDGIRPVSAALPANARPAWTPPWPGPNADPARLAAARQRLAIALGDDRRPYAVLVPRAGGAHAGASKDWPALGTLPTLLQQAGLRVLMAPGPGESAAFAAAAPAAECLDGLGLVDFGLLAAGARLVIAPDSGQAHLAAAAGAPVLAVFGPTAPARCRPWSPRVEVLGGNGQWPSPATVEAAILRRLASSDPTNSC